MLVARAMCVLKSYVASIMDLLAEQLYYLIYRP